MPSCGIGLGLPYAGTRIDQDALAYFNRAGITDPTAKQQIIDFVKGVKALGLWNNMVCWPLRSSQNKGTGTTAFSLGGLGTFNGTLVNGPTWGAGGVSFVRASNQFIITPTLPTVSTLSSILSVAYTPLTLASDRQNVCRWGGSSNTSTFGIFQEWPSFSNGTEGGGLGFSIDPTPIINARHLALSGFTSLSTTNGYYQNSTSNVIIAGNNTPLATSTTPLTIGQWSGGGGHAFNGEVSFVAALNGVAATTSNLYSSFRTLYNSTLGAGFNLPA
jgi:hypothetical protein